MTTTYTRGNTYYELSNYLGNPDNRPGQVILAVVSDRKIAHESLTTPGLVDYFLAEACAERSRSIVSSTDYYPGVYTERSRSGMQMDNRSFSSDAYRYGYQGSEKDDEIKGSGNSYDFGARIYDPRIGRFLSVDPLSAEFCRESNYTYAGNIPVYYIDEGGNKKTTYISKIENGVKTTEVVVDANYVIKIKEKRTIQVMKQGAPGQGSYGVEYQEITIEVDYDVVEFVTVNLDANTINTTDEIATRPTGAIGDVVEAIQSGLSYLSKLMQPTKQADQGGGSPLVSKDLDIPTNLSQYLPTAKNIGKSIDISEFVGPKNVAKLTPSDFQMIVDVYRQGMSLGRSLGNGYNKAKEYYQKEKAKNTSPVKETNANKGEIIFIGSRGDRSNPRTYKTSADSAETVKYLKSFMGEGETKATEYPKEKNKL